MKKQNNKLPLVFFLIVIFSVATVYCDPPTRVWQKRYDASQSNSQDSAIGVSVNGNGNVFVTGWAVGSGNSDIATLRYNPDNGDTIWVKKTGGPLDDKPLSIISDNSFVYVTGWTFVAAGARDIITIKYNASNGDTVWVRRYNGPGSGGDYGIVINIDGSGNVYVAGRTAEVGNVQKFIVLKYDNSGNMLSGWPSIYTGSLSNAFDEAHGVVIDGTGNVYVTGLSRSGPSITQDWLTLKINSDGVVQWAKKYSGALNNEDYAAGLVLDAAGNNLFVAGYAYNLNSAYSDYVTIKYAAGSGDSLASAIYNGPLSSVDVVTAITKDGNDNLYITGFSTGTGTSYDYATVSYNANLNQRWVMRYSGPLEDRASSIAYSQGYVYVTGSSQNTGMGFDYLTVRYNAANGTEMWTVRENGEANRDDYSNSIAILDSNNVFITGSASYGSPFGTDYLTIRYSEPVGVIPISSNVPASFALLQNYPNPFNPSTTIRFNIPNFSYVRLSVLDVTGREITVLADQNLRAGEYESVWNASGISSGVYFYRLIAGDYAETRKMTLVK